MVVCRGKNKDITLIQKLPDFVEFVGDLQSEQCDCGGCDCDDCDCGGCPGNDDELEDKFDINDPRR